MHVLSEIRTNSVSSNTSYHSRRYFVTTCWQISKFIAMSWIVFLDNREMKLSPSFNTVYDLTIGHQLPVLKNLDCDFHVTMITENTQIN